FDARYHADAHHVGGTADPIPVESDGTIELIDETNLHLLALPGVQHRRWPLTGEAFHLRRRPVGVHQLCCTLARRQDREAVARILRKKSMRRCNQCRAAANETAS